MLVDVEGDWTGMSGDQAGVGYRLVGLAQISAGAARFLKMTGPTGVLAPELDAFHALATSFRVAESAPTTTPTTTSDTSDSGGLTWSAPDDWTLAPPRSMRVVSYEAGAGECYVVVLAGEGGGLEANVNRWRGQVGAGPLAAEEVAALPTIEMLGRTASLVEVRGDDGGAALLGAICMLPESSVFVKWVGPDVEVEGLRPAFLAFCGSLDATPETAR